MRHEGRILLEMFSRIYDTARVARVIYAGGAILSEVRATHSLAVVEVIEDSLVNAEASRA